MRTEEARAEIEQRDAAPQRLRITFTKGENLRYISHLDLARTWERVLRRAGIPVLYSRGYHPHPKIVFAAALPVGCTGAAEVMDVVRQAPLVGGAAASFLTGDVFVSGATLSRYFALHVIVLPWLVFGLLVLHFVVVRKHGAAPPPGYAERNDPGMPFFPHHLLRIVMVSALVLAIAISLAALFPRPIGDPATPFELPDRLLSTWIVVDVSLGLIRYLGVWGFVGFSALGILLVVVPLVDRRSAVRFRKRPVAAAIGVAFFLGFLVFWVLGSRVDSVAPSSAVESRILQERAVPTPPPSGSDAADEAETATPEVGEEGAAE